MRSILVQTLLISVFICSSVLADAPCNSSHLIQAHRLINELERKSPSHDGVPLRSYSLQDLNHDGCMEVLEKISPIEEQAMGLLNVEIYPATEWVNVYVYKKGKYSEATSEYHWFLQKRRQHYKLWLRLINNSAVLNDDSRDLLKHKENRERLIKFLNEFIEKIDKLTKH